MRKIAVIGLDQNKDAVMSRLMDFGAVELTDQRAKADAAELDSFLSLDKSQERASALDGKITQGETTLSIIEKYNDAKAPLFNSRRSISKAEGNAIKARLEKTQEGILAILQLEEKIRKAKENINKLEQDKIYLTPWQQYGNPLEETKTYRTATKLGVMPQSPETEGVLAEIGQNPSVIIEEIHKDKDLCYIAMIYLDEAGDEALEGLKKHGFAEMSFKGFVGTPKENLERIDNEVAQIQGDILELEGQLKEMVPLKKDIEEYCDILTIERDKERAKANLMQTKKTFMLEGWIPSRLEKKAEKLLTEEGCYYVIRDPQEDEEVPVLLDNRSFFVPFEAITEMYSLPDYKGFDPTSIYAAFYAIFFGMMLSDAGYGIIMTLACFIALKKFDLEGTTFKMIKLFFYCGISTTVWGALFGGWFGDIVPVFAKTVLGKDVIINPLWFNPLDDPMKLLIFSLALGVIHLFIGMGIKAYMQIREGNWFDAICDEGFWYLTIIGLVAWLGGGSLSPSLPDIGMYMAIVGMAGLLLTGGRHNKGFGKITGGLGNLYNITSYLSDILSYARLLALGLATGVIAQVVNTMGSLFGGGVVGIIILVVIFIAGHGLNLAINALGAFIHASRLQYVEFFGKFYEDGGEPFDPFRKKTKYIRIDHEEE